MPMWWRQTIQMLALTMFLGGIWDETLGDRDGTFWVVGGIFALLYLLVEAARIGSPRRISKPEPKGNNWVDAALKKTAEKSEAR